MDAHTQEQQQKDFMSTFFPPGDHTNHAMGSAQQQQQQQGLFSGSASNQNGMLGHGIHPPTNATTNTNMSTDIDLIGSFMNMQQPLSPSQQAPSYNPQVLIEQQFKLTQLQQLQQLQNQIFQQQVSW